MPGIIYHLTFAQEILKHARKKDIHLDKDNFLAGNLIPDLAINKKLSHYRMEGSEKGFFVPNLDKAKKDLYTKGDDLKLGIYSHLYLDYHFIENYLIKAFIWDRENMKVINKTNQKAWPTSLFFDKPNNGGVLYKGYTEVNKMMIKNGNINLDEINNIPKILPETGFEIFDERREKTWKDELDSYLKEDITYTGEILDYSHLLKSIVLFAKNFVENEL